MATRFVARGKWKKINVDPNIVLQKDLENLICIEELTDYDIITSKKKKHESKEDSSTSDITTDTTIDRTRDTKRDTRRDRTIDRTKKKLRRTNEIIESETAMTLHHMSAWNGLYVPKQVMCSLSEAGFVAPTAIQSLVLPSAIRDRLDIVGAAETGSGKTLSFGIPIVHHILEAKLRQVAVCTIDDTTLDSELSHIPDAGESLKPLYALIITPTRELAMQVTDHITVITKYTDIQVCPVVGGMSIEKQTRLLKRSPEIVVGTPGRLWQLIQQGDEHLSKVKAIKYLVIDEADRMVEKNHFPELSSLLLLINDWPRQRKRQTFVFSATLTFVHTKPQRLDLKRKNTHQMTTTEKLELLRSQIGMSDKPKVIDLTRAQGVACSLTEARINCTVDEKDVYLYEFVLFYPGRTLVFCNSIDCVRRLVSVLTLLHCSPLPLHADMHQRQRLKNLDRFKSNPCAVLIATDVAARGLDIPNVQHVIHYQVPRTTENYVHRSGRTARAMKEGLSIMLVGPDDVKNYRKIIKALNRDEELPVFPVEFEFLSVVKSRVNLARQLDKERHRVSKKRMQNLWIEQAARDMDIEIDSNNASDDDVDSQQTAAHSRKLSAMKQQLDLMLSQPIRNESHSGKYPTKTGKLSQPFLTVCVPQESAVAKVKRDKLDKKRTRKH